MNPVPAVRSISGDLRSLDVIVDLQQGAGRLVRVLSVGKVEVWVARGPSGTSDAALLRAFTEFDRVPSAGALEKLLSDLRGHFAIIARGPRWVVGAVDRARTIPVFIVQAAEGWRVGFNGGALSRHVNFGASDIDGAGALALAMAGYTSGARTLYRGMTQLRAGECVYLAEDHLPNRRRYYRWRPWRLQPTDDARAKRELADLTLAAVERAITYADGRQIAVPLSAGYDSRVIASALKKLGARNVVTFAYGLPGNFEMQTSGQIAERLGFPWRFVPLSVGRQSCFFRASLHAEYLRYADTCSATPFEQDIAPVFTLREDGFIASDAVMINGNTGDFISGNHIVPQLCAIPDGQDLQQRRARIVQAVIGKHFALWRSLQTRERVSQIEEELNAEIDDIGADFADPAGDHGVYEYLEFNDRQTKYVINGQRAYEFLGLDWALPLWDDDYLEFWQRMPLSQKVSQRLYRETLVNENWGGVWSMIPVNSRNVRPWWLVPLRGAGKVLSAPFGIEAWHKADHHLFKYWYDNLCNYANTPYRKVVFDRRGFRSAISFHTEAYLASKGLKFDGTPHSLTGGL